MSSGGDAYHIFETPVTAGYYQIGGGTYNVMVHLAQKPNWVAKKMSKFLLGWEWFDNEQINKTTGE